MFTFRPFLFAHKAPGFRFRFFAFAFLFALFVTLFFAFFARPAGAAARILQSDMSPPTSTPLSTYPLTSNPTAPIL